MDHHAHPAKRPAWEAYSETYRRGLLEDVLPFWNRHSIDHEYGGYLLNLDRDGSILSTDKSVWVHGRFVWLLATLYSDVEARGEWLDLARHGLRFLREYAFDADGRMFFSLDREGRPLRKRRYLFSECFGVIALAAYAKAAKDSEAGQQAAELFDLIIRLHTTPGSLEPKVNPSTRPMKGLAMPMALIFTAQELRDAGAGSEDDVTRWIDRCVGEIERDFMKPEMKAVLETTGPDGEFYDTFEGRLLNPGHAIEAAWFILREADYRGGDERLRRIGLTILDWMWKWGWDAEYGGFLYFRDVKNLPCMEYWHDMKFWWPHNEAIIATLYAYRQTGDPKYARWHQQAHEWAYAHFPDPEYGEWFGYLHRDGRLSTRLKGNGWKGPFHLPRMQLYGWKLAGEIVTAGI